MERLFTDIVRIQIAVVEGWIHGLTHLWRTWQHMAMLNYEVTRHPTFQRWHDLMPSGADWWSNYGRRARDVDVDHMR